jgi:hypothetical protein
VGWGAMPAMAPWPNARAAAARRNRIDFIRLNGVD